MTNLTARYRYIGIIVMHINGANIITREATFLIEETGNIHLIDLILLSFTDIEGSPNGRSRTSHTLGQRIVCHLFGKILWSTLLTVQDQIGATFGIPACRTTCAMNMVFSL